MSIKINPYKILGTTGLKQSSGFVFEETLPYLQGAQAAKYYKEMIDNSSVIGAIRYAIQMLVRQTDYWIQPAEVEGSEGLKWGEFVTDCFSDLDDQTFDDFISEATSCFDFGWAFFETTYKKREDGLIGWKELGLRSQDSLWRWEFDENNKVLGMHQLDPYSGRQVFIPSFKAIHFRTERVKNNPEGRSIFRTAVFDWHYYKNICKIEGIGIERDLAGLPCMEVPIEMLSSEATPEQKNLLIALEKMLAEIKCDERGYVITPSEISEDGSPTGYKFKLISSGGSRQIDTTRVKQEYKINILQSTMGQFLQLGMQGVGSFALASTQTDLFAVALGSLLKMLGSVFTKQGIQPLMKINNVPREYWPSLEFGDIETPALETLAAYVSALAGAGILPVDDKAIRDKLLSVADLPIPQDDGDFSKSCDCHIKHKPSNVFKVLKKYNRSGKK